MLLLQTDANPPNFTLTGKEKNIAMQFNFGFASTTLTIYLTCHQYAYSSASVDAMVSGYISYLTYHAEWESTNAVVVVVLSVEHALNEAVTETESGRCETVEDIRGHFSVVS